MGNEVNIKYVLSLEEQLDKTLLLKKTPIDVREDAIFHLKSMSESYEYNICDMSRFFETLCPNGEKKYEVCFPSEYNQVDLNKFFATRPPFINPWDYRIEKKQKKDSWEKQEYFCFKCGNALSESDIKDKYCAYCGIPIEYIKHQIKIKKN